MQTLKILNKKEIKPILGLIKKQWNCAPSFDYVFLMNDKGRIYISCKRVFEIDFKTIRIDTLGSYFGEIKNDNLRLSIEGSQIIGPYAKNNVLELDDFEAREWIRGIDLDKKTELKGFVIIKNKNDFLGTGRVKEDKVLNFIPKARRAVSSD